MQSILNSKGITLQILEYSGQAKQQSMLSEAFR